MGIYIPAVFYNYDSFGQQIGVGTASNNIFERYFSPVGQGFMIEGAEGTSGIVTMKNKYRVFVKEGAANFSEFERSANNQISSSGAALPEIISVSGFDYTTVSTTPVPQIRFDVLLNNEGRRIIVAAFDPEATDGADHAMDASADAAELPANAYFLINENPFLIDVMPFDIHKKIPVGFQNTNEANYKITISETVGLPEIQNIYLHDKIADLYFDIKNDIHELVLPAGTNDTQYEVTFEDGTLSTGSEDLKTVIISQDNDARRLLVENAQSLQLEQCYIYDISGKLVLQHELKNTAASFSVDTTSLSEGVYIVRLSAVDIKPFCKKIIIINQ
ncbi:T9SS type A sorting domain-containing protein [Flavobacterium sp. 3HN19-14]|uniref:T9SS type A sorting domain-containing protein n=1 Tax=Flavobacterium sp. 3HN19-14 TaxID=3448133 RepID=UPI003EE23ED0